MNIYLAGIILLCLAIFPAAPIPERKIELWYSTL